MYVNQYNQRDKEKMEAQATAIYKGSIVAETSPTDNELISQARSGRTAALEALFNKHRSIVFRFVYQIVGDKDDADDIVQETFVRALENLNRFREECRFSTWILRIAANLCTDKFRMKTRRAVLLQQQATDRLSWMTSDPSGDPVTALEGDRRAQAVHRALKALPLHHRTVLILRDFEQREYPEIAEILNCTAGGAKLRVLRARRALKDRLEPLLEEEKA